MKEIDLRTQPLPEESLVAESDLFHTNFVQPLAKESLVTESDITEMKNFAKVFRETRLKLGYFQGCGQI